MKYFTKLVFLTFIISLLSLNVSAVSNVEVAQNTIINFYELAYDSWWKLENVSFDEVLDMNTVQSHNKVIAFKENIFNWKYSIENGYFKGEREKNTISFDFVDSEILENDTIIISVMINADQEGAVYPFFVSLGENIFKLTYIEGKWLISEHKYEDAYYYEKSLTDKMEINYNEIVNNYTQSSVTGTNNTVFSETLNSDILPCAYPYTDHDYSATRAVKYANKFCESGNSYFYTASKDCTNFVSQCISYGFGSTAGYKKATSYKMVNTGVYSTGWYAGSGGGSSAWENVLNHWTYMTSTKTNSEGPRVRTIAYSNLSAGDVMQLDTDGDGVYNHSTILVDDVNMQFAQHSNNGLRYFAEYPGGAKRYYRPLYFRTY